MREKRISYAKSKSYATLRREDPNFIPPSFAHAASAKRVREAEESNVRAKREKVVDADDEEMDIEDDDETGPPTSTTSNSTSCISPTVPKLCNNVYTVTIVHSAQVQPSNKLQCSNLPQEVTNGVLAVLFQQCVSMSHRFIIRLSPNHLGTGVSRRRRSNRRQNPTLPEKRSKQQKLSSRTRSLRQLQDRC